MGSWLMKGASESCGATGVAVVVVQRDGAVHSCVAAAGCGVIDLGSSNDGPLGSRRDRSRQRRGLYDHHCWPAVQRQLAAAAALDPPWSSWDQTWFVLDVVCWLGKRWCRRPSPTQLDGLSGRDPRSRRKQKKVESPGRYWQSNEMGSETVDGREARTRVVCRCDGGGCL